MLLSRVIFLIINKFHRKIEITNKSIKKRNIYNGLLFQEIKPSVITIKDLRETKFKSWPRLIYTEICDSLKNNDDSKETAVKFVSIAHANHNLNFKERSGLKTHYYYEDGLRKVHPYYYTYNTSIKKRWVGEKILDIFTKEFRAFPIAEYERCIRSGTLTVNNQKVNPDYRLKSSDIIVKTIHRHEDPVINQPITFIHLDDNIVIINKPASIPVYPCGRYQFNTVTFILASEYNIKNLKPIHRLDKQTSGLLLLGRTSKISSELASQFTNRLVQKEYICRVSGKFPMGEIVCQQPLKVVKNKISLCKVSPDGKDSLTIFKRVSYNTKTKTSLVLCYPKTGRMHQIRVHLQYLGYPIVNDSRYNNSVTGSLGGKGHLVVKSDEQYMLDDIVGPNKIVQNSKEYNQTNKFKNSESYNSFQSTSTLEQITYPKTAEELTFDPDCYHCSVQYQDPRPQDMLIYLHAWKYKGLGWEYKTDFPEWVKTDWLE